jgi:hypothetical protein
MPNTEPSRSPQWEGVRTKFIAKHPSCFCCGNLKNNDVHHLIPFHVLGILKHPELELDPRNLVTLCLEHHLHVGHLGDFKNLNPAVISDLETAKTICQNPNYNKDEFYKSIKTHETLVVIPAIKNLLQVILSHPVETL